MLNAHSFFSFRTQLFDRKSVVALFRNLLVVSRKIYYPYTSSCFIFNSSGQLAYCLVNSPSRDLDDQWFKNLFEVDFRFEVIGDEVAGLRLTETSISDRSCTPWHWPACTARQLACIICSSRSSRGSTGLFSSLLGTRGSFNGSVYCTRERDVSAASPFRWTQLFGYNVYVTHHVYSILLFRTVDSDEQDLLEALLRL